MNKRGDDNNRSKLTIIPLLFAYCLGSTLFLTILYARGTYWKNVYQNALWDTHSLERVRHFFKRIKPILKVMYPVVDELWNLSY